MVSSAAVSVVSAAAVSCVSSAGFSSVAALPELPHAISDMVIAAVRIAASAFLPFNCFINESSFSGSCSLDRSHFCSYVTKNSLIVFILYKYYTKLYTGQNAYPFNYSDILISVSVLIF